MDAPEASVGNTLYLPVPGERLSPSQVRTFIECQAKWAFKYLESLPEPATASLTLGKAVHAALEHNFRQKVESGQDLPVADVVGSYRETFQTLAKEAEFREDEDQAVVLESGAAMVKLYHEEFGPAI